MHGQEIELKLRIEQADEMVRRLHASGARFIGTKTQRDRLFNSPVIDFAQFDQALRLRIEKQHDEHIGILTFKGTPRFNADGHKIRDEFESVVQDAVMMEKILESLGFTHALTIEKTRTSYMLDGVAIELDTLTFGTFLELEGTSEAIERVRTTLQLQDAQPLTKSYVVLYHEWREKSRSDEVGSPARTE